MCKAASFMVTKDNVFWSETSDSHLEIIKEHNIHVDGVRGPNAVSVEISPPGGNLALPLSRWIWKVDQDTLPDWWDAEDAECGTRAALRDWKKNKLGKLMLEEAFNPINPLLVKGKNLPKKEQLKLLKDWASVRDSVWASVRDSVWESVWESVGDSVWESVRASVNAYNGSLWHGITEWKYTDLERPWDSLRKLWVNGYLPSHDGKTWRLHRGKNAKVVLDWNPRR